MNLQQLNQSGQQLHTFVITALVSMVITGVTWLCIARINHARQWIRDPSQTKDNKGRPSYNIEIRLAILYSFVFGSQDRDTVDRHAAVRWLFKSKAWLHILFNSPAHSNAMTYLSSGMGFVDGDRWIASELVVDYIVRGIYWDDHLTEARWDWPTISNFLGR